MNEAPKKPRVVLQYPSRKKREVLFESGSSCHSFIFVCLAGANGRSVENKNSTWGVLILTNPGHPVIFSDDWDVQSPPKRIVFRFDYPFSEGEPGPLGKTCIRQTDCSWKRVSN